MKGAIQPWNRKKWAITSGAILLVALVANHLIAPEFFPTHPNYVFPWVQILFTLLAFPLTLFISWICFRWYLTKHFAQQVTLRNSVAFLLTVLGLFTGLYWAVYFGLIGLLHLEFNVQKLLTGWLVSLLIAGVALALLYAHPLYVLHRAGLSSGTLRVRSGSRTVFLPYAEIAYFFSQNKVVYLIKPTGEYLLTEFTLGELEGRLPMETFFRANRQALVHRQAVSSLESEANGKLQVHLSVPFQAWNTLIVSRYKAKELKQWLAGQ